ncbi:MAG: hypothetical protein WCJ76_08755 [Comamonadaceae bacterium]
MKSKTQIIVRGVRLWPLEWRYIGWMVYITLNLGVLQVGTGIGVIALMLPRVPELGLFQESAYLIRQFIPPIVQDYLPLFVAWLFTANAVRSMVDAWRNEP